MINLKELRSIHKHYASMKKLDIPLKVTWTPEKLSPSKS
jgi:hypothetical protein